jgi:O-antigen/teichoic acid export membrane protein
MSLVARLWKSEYVRSVAGTYGTRLVLLPLSLGASVLQARLLGPEGRGEVQLLTTTANIAVLYLGFGLATSIAFHVAAGKVSPSSLVAPLVRTLLATCAIMGTAILGLHAAGLSEHVIGTLPIGVSLPTLLGLFALLLTNAWLAAIAAARREFAFINRSSIAVVVVTTSCYALGIALGVPVSSTAYVAGVLVASELVRGALYAWRLLQVERGVPAQGLSVPLTAMISYSLLAYACDVVQFLTYRLDVWIVRYYRGDAELGQYALAVTLAEMVWLFAGALATVLFPHVPGMTKLAAIQLTLRVAAVSFAASTVIAGAGYALAVPLVPILFTEGFAPSVPMLGVLLLGSVPISVAKIVGNYIAGANALRLSLYSAVVGMVVCLSLDFLIIPARGALGAAAATSISYVVFTVVLTSLFVRHTGLAPVQLVRLAIGPRPGVDRDGG